MEQENNNFKPFQMLPGDDWTANFGLNWSEKEMQVFFHTKISPIIKDYMGEADKNEMHELDHLFNAITALATNEHEERWLMFVASRKIEEIESYERNRADDLVSDLIETLSRGRSSGIAEFLGGLIIERRRG